MPSSVVAGAVGQTNNQLLVFWVVGHRQGVVLDRLSYVLVAGLGRDEAGDQRLAPLAAVPVGDAEPLRDPQVGRNLYYLRSRFYDPQIGRFVFVNQKQRHGDDVKRRYFWVVR